MIIHPEPFRLAPKMPASAYKTYALRLPKTTHYRKVTCQEVTDTCYTLLSGDFALDTAVYCEEEHCAHYTHGWTTKIDVSTELGQRQAKYIENRSGRKYFADSTRKPIVTYVFKPGQQCFADHQVSLEREPLYIVRGGDWRGNPRGEVHTHVRAGDWIDDFATHQQHIVSEIEKG